MPGAIIAEVHLDLGGAVVEALSRGRAQGRLQRAPVRPAMEVAVVAAEQPAGKEAGTSGVGVRGRIHCRVILNSVILRLYDKSGYPIYKIGFSVG